VRANLVQREEHEHRTVRAIGERRAPPRRDEEYDRSRERRVLKRPRQPVDRRDRERHEQARENRKQDGRRAHGEPLGRTRPSFAAQPCAAQDVCERRPEGD